MCLVDALAVHTVRRVGNIFVVEPCCVRPPLDRADVDAVRQGKGRRPLRLSVRVVIHVEVECAPAVTP